MTLPRTVLRLPLLLAVLGLSACGGGGGGGDGGGGSTSSTTWKVLDLTSGTLTSTTTIDLTQTQFTSTHIAFREIPASASGGAAFWIAVFELTQEQWRNLVADGSNRPWRAATPTAITGSNSAAAGLPASGLSEADLVAGLGTWNGRSTVDLAIPRDEQWEFACRGAATTAFFWGDTIATATVDDFAITSQTMPGASGPAPVGGTRLSNAFGLWDMAGNVREWVDRGAGLYELRGGGWTDDTWRCRAANPIRSVSAFRHALSGARLVLAP